MSEPLTLRPLAVAPERDVVVFAQPGLVGAHVGLDYRADDVGARRLLHLAWHFDLRDEEDHQVRTEDGVWVEPTLDVLALHDVRAVAALIAARNEEGRVPYAFEAADAELDAEGRLQLNGSLGLTCATFVLRVFLRAGIRLVDEPTWAARSAERAAEDGAAQARLLIELRKHRDPGAATHADRVQQQVGCMRIRAEEVAAASGLEPCPIPYERAEPGGRQVLAALA